MILVKLHNIKKYFSERLILDIPSLEIFSGDKIGVVGGNGAGKTTLLNIISGDTCPDEGVRAAYASVSYIRQFSQETASADSRLVSEFSIRGKYEHASMSGGEQTRLRIAGALSESSMLLLADEPTSNLDTSGVELVYNKLKRIETLVIVSHDRHLLDRLCTKIVEIKDGTVNEYMGNYSNYQAQSYAEQQRQQIEYQQYLGEQARLIRSSQKAQQRAGAIKKAPGRMGNSEARLHKREAAQSQQKLHSSSKSIRSRLDRMERVEKPADISKIKLDLMLTEPPRNKIIASCSQLNFAYDGYTVFQNASFEIYNNAKTLISGINGSGKTTLLKLIADRYPGISVAPKARFGYFHQSFGYLDFNKTVIENAMRNSVQTENTVRLILARLLFRGGDVFKQTSVLSGGEKVKLSLAQLLVSDANVLLLDEPTNYLDIPSVEAVQALLMDYEGTVVLVSHDKAFAEAVTGRELTVNDKKITVSENSGGYQTQKPEKRGDSKLVLELRLAAVSSKLSTLPPGAAEEKTALEAEYTMLSKTLREIP